MVPSLHQFVTSSVNASDPNVRTKNERCFFFFEKKIQLFSRVLSVQTEPGLGLSDLWYSWIVSIVSVGQLLGAVAVGVFTKFFFTKYILLTMLAVCCSGGILYAIGQYGWMLLLGWSANILVQLHINAFCCQGNRVVVVATVDIKSCLHVQINSVFVIADCGFCM